MKKNDKKRKKAERRNQNNGAKDTTEKCVYKTRTKNRKGTIKNKTRQKKNDS